MFNVVLVHPEIPPNTGNVIRLCANTGCALHLIEPLGFSTDDTRMRRAGLDYHEFTSLKIHPAWERFLESERPARMLAITTGGQSTLAATRFRAGDWLVFGSESAGLPAPVRASFESAATIRLPMRPGNRSLNLSNAVAVVVFEAWRQQGFAGGE